jgi:hypothetical protein
MEKNNGLEVLSVNDIKDLPLKERSQLVLNNYFNGHGKVRGDKSLVSFVPYLEAWEFLEKEGYVNLVGGTPKSGAAYKITEKGLKFMDEVI